MLKEILKERIKQPKGCVKVERVSGTLFILIMCSILKGSSARLNLQFELSGVRLTSTLSYLPQSLSSGLEPEPEGRNEREMMTLVHCFLTWMPSNLPKSLLC